MDKFTASNGYKIESEGEYYAAIRRPNNTLKYSDYLDGDDMQALREFFRAEEDNRLGRWRSPEFPDYVVYPGDEWIIILREPDGNTFVRTRGDVGLTGGTPVDSAARTYFDAHPEPKPWHSATVDEIWVITTRDGRTRAAFREPDGTWETATYGDGQSDCSHEGEITAAYRIYPES